MTHRKKVLMICYYWPPAGGPGSLRVVKFARYLSQFGWEPVILTVQKGEFPYIDRSLEREIQGTMEPSGSRRKMGPAVRIDGKHFVKSLHLHSLVANSERTGKDFYDQVRSALLQKVAADAYRDETSLSWKLITIIFQVMPYFIRKNRGFERERFGEKEIKCILGCRQVAVHAVHDHTRGVVDMGGGTPGPDSRLDFMAGGTKIGGRCANHGIVTDAEKGKGD